jgi:glycosyltransferase involved in cell wall biosynthesis
VSGADVMCLLSDYEAHPVAVMEALGTGTRALIADNSGLTELGEAGLAKTIPTDSAPDVVAAELLAIASSPRTAPPRLQTWDDCAEQLHALYREVAR